MDWLAELVRRGLVWRYPEGVSAGVRQRVQHELGLIETLNFSHYFLTVYDVVRFARSQGILCQGRGSAANSAVCYALGITAVDPNCSSLLFERFISAERGEPPDIDVDFEHERREEVIQYIYERYGRHRAALTNEFITYRMRSAIRDVGKVFGLSLDQVERLAGATHRLSAGTRAAEEELVEEAGLDPSECLVRKTIEIAREIKGLPRHVSIHVGGFVISNDVLIDLVPVEPATMEGRTVIQWDKDDIAALGFVKVDVLGLGMLTAIRKGLCLIEQAGGPAYCLATVPPEDSLVYDMFCRADTVGVFQIESRAQMSMLPRLKPRCFYDLVIEVAIVRPGPIQGGMVHPYLSRRSGQTPITYAHPDLHPILDRTLGVPLFQEQVMQMAVAVGGFTPGEADALRRAMGAWRKRGTLDGLGRRLVQAMLERGISSHYAESIFAQIKGFGEYGFPESHAASFALLVYVSGWMKCHYPAAFAAALINSQPMGFYSARSIVSDAERHEVCVRPICVGSSEWNCTLEGGYDEEDGVALRLGFRLIRGLGERDVNAFVKERKRRPFQSLMDFASRSGLSRRSLEAFASANALSLFGVDRRTALWKLLGRWERLPLFEHHARCEPEPELPFETDRMSIERDYQTVGLSVGKHPMQIVRPQLDIQIQPLSHITGMKSGEYVCIAGLVTSRQRPGTANGVVFITLEDESALVNLVVWPRVWEEQRKLARTSVLLGVKGVIQKDGAACSVLVHQFWSVDRSIVCVETNARDFR